jgi:hypothetical protein
LAAPEATRVPGSEVQGSKVQGLVPPLTDGAASFIDKETLKKRISIIE